MPPDEFADIPADVRAMTHAELANFVGEGLKSNKFGYARAELVRRDREFQQQMSTAADNREINRQRFDEELAQRQMKHAAGLAREQLDTARGAKWAAIAAAIAALLSAVGGI